MQHPPLLEITPLFSPCSPQGNTFQRAQYLLRMRLSIPKRRGRALGKPLSLSRHLTTCCFNVCGVQTAHGESTDFAGVLAEAKKCSKAELEKTELHPLSQHTGRASVCQTT